VKARLVLSDAELGWLLLAMAAGAVGALPLSGWLIARNGSRRMTSACAIALCLALPLPVLAPTVALAALALLLLGAANALLDVSMNAQAVEAERHHAASDHVVVPCAVQRGRAGGRRARQRRHDGRSGRRDACRGGSHRLAADSGHRPTRVASIAAGPDGERRSGARAPARAARALGCARVLRAWWPRARSATGAPSTCATVSGRRPPGRARLRGVLARHGRWTLRGDALVRRFGAERVLRSSALVAATGLAAALIVASPTAGIVGFGLVGIGIANVIPILFSAAAAFPDVQPGMGHSRQVATAGYAGFLPTRGRPEIGFVSDRSRHQARAMARRVARALAAVIACAARCRPVAVRPRL
jgi:hypothetical protein